MKGIQVLSDQNSEAELEMIDKKKDQDGVQELVKTNNERT